MRHKPSGCCYCERSAAPPIRGWLTLARSSSSADHRISTVVQAPAFTALASLLRVDRALPQVPRSTTASSSRKPLANASDRSESCWAASPLLGTHRCEVVRWLERQAVSYESLDLQQFWLRSHANLFRPRQQCSRYLGPARSDQAG